MQALCRSRSTAALPRYSHLTSTRQARSLRFSVFAKELDQRETSTRIHLIPARMVMGAKHHLCTSSIHRETKDLPTHFRFLSDTSAPPSMNSSGVPHKNFRDDNECLCLATSRGTGHASAELKSMKLLSVHPPNPSLDTKDPWTLRTPQFQLKIIPICPQYPAFGLRHCCLRD